MSFGFFFLNITKLSASKSFDKEEKSGLVLSPISVSISSSSFLAIISKGLLFVSVASNPRSIYFFENAD